MTRIVWTDVARSDIRRLDRQTALRVFAVLLRFRNSGEGDVKALQGQEELRLRIGDYRLFFVITGEVLEVRRVLHRSEAYRH